jgi:hypothetical protein
MRGQARRKGQPMKRTKILASLAVAGAVALAAPLAALAQNNQGTRGKARATKAEEPKKVKSYDFTGDEIDGELVKPDGDFLDTRKFASHTNLIRLRKDFIREIVKSAEDL